MSDSHEHEVRELRSLYWSERDPDGRGFAPLADACRRAGDHQEAKELLAEGLERLPHFASGHVVAARLHLDMGDVDAAAISLDRVLDIDGENAEALAGLGTIRAEAGDLQIALQLFKRLAVVAPGDVSVADRIRSLEQAVDEGGALRGDSIWEDSGADSSVDDLDDGSRGFETDRSDPAAEDAVGYDTVQATAEPADSEWQASTPPVDLEAEEAFRDENSIDPFEVAAASDVTEHEAVPPADEPLDQAIVVDDLAPTDEVTYPAADPGWMDETELDAASEPAEWTGGADEHLTTADTAEPAPTDVDALAPTEVGALAPTEVGDLAPTEVGDLAPTEVGDLAPLDVDDLAPLGANASDVWSGDTVPEGDPPSNVGAAEDVESMAPEPEEPGESVSDEVSVTEPAAGIAQDEWAIADLTADPSFDEDEIDATAPPLETVKDFGEAVESDTLPVDEFAVEVEAEWELDRETQEQAPDAMIAETQPFETPDSDAVEVETFEVAESESAELESSTAFESEAGEIETFEAPGSETIGVAEFESFEALDAEEPEAPDPSTLEVAEPEGFDPTEAAVLSSGHEPAGQDEGSPWATEEPEPSPDLDGELYTRTLAELYADQGLFARAVEVYEHLVKAEPGDPDLQVRLEELEALARPDSAYVPAPETSDPFSFEPDVEVVASDSAEDDEFAALDPPTSIADLSASSEATEPPDADAMALDEDLEVLAADLAAGPDASDVSTPFAWSDPEPEPEGDSETSRPVADYLNDLLTWQPAEPVVEDQSSVADDAISIAALAPDVGAVQDPVATQQVHDPEIVPIASLAPDAEAAIVPIESLAPSSTESGGTERAAQFQDWMRRLRE